MGSVLGVETHFAVAGNAATSVLDVGDLPERASWMHLSGSALIDAVRRADVLLPSEGELATLGLDIVDLLAAGAAVCTTLGAAGVEVRDPEGGVTRLPAITVRAVDTDGAGDSFAGGSVAAALCGADPVRAARAGLNAAARAVVVDGPMTVEFAPDAVDQIR